VDWSTLTGSSTTSGAIARWLNKSDLSSGPSGDADLILQEATGWIYARLRHWQMLTAPISGTMVAGGTGDRIAVPTDMLEPDFLMIAGVVGGTFYQQELRQRQPNEIYRAWSYDGSGNRVQQQPMLYSFNQSYIQLDSVPDFAYPYVQTYYQQPAPLGGNNLTNFLTTFYPRLVRTTCMMMGAEYVKENAQGSYDRTYWAQQAQIELEAAQAQSGRARRGAVGSAIIGEVALAGYGGW